MPIPSANGNKYLMTFVDDYSRMCWAYLLKTKSKAFQTLKNFHAWIENQAQACIGTVVRYIVVGLPLFLSSPDHFFEPVLYFEIDR